MADALGVGPLTEHILQKRSRGAHRVVVNQSRSSEAEAVSAVDFKWLEDEFPSCDFGNRD